MYKMRQWSVSNAFRLNSLYNILESFLFYCHPLFKRIGYERLEHIFFPMEKMLKRSLFDSQSCGQCSLGSSGMSCPMNCPKSLRNGPCGGVRANGNCEVKAEMPCVWVLAWQGSGRMPGGEKKIQIVSAPVDVRLAGTSAWLREVRQHHGYKELESLR